MKQIISNTEYSGERPLYQTSSLRLNNIIIREGESALKECRQLDIVDSLFEGLYVLWECADVHCVNCRFTTTSRASVWYGKRLRFTNCTIESHKAFRELRKAKFENVKIYKGGEVFWKCFHLDINKMTINFSEYAFLQTRHSVIKNLILHGKYCFQYATDIEIHNAKLDTKDAFWNSENCTVYDSEINGEYLGWYSKNLRLVRCRISGKQPLCYAENLVLEDCTFASDADLCFEHSDVKATVKGMITSVKNPKSGHVVADKIGELILNDQCKEPHNCQITTRQ